MKRCEHYWHHVHTVWAGHEDADDAAVMRYCGKCGVGQMAYTKQWQPIPAKYVDMREIAKKRGEE